MGVKYVPKPPLFFLVLNHTAKEEISLNMKICKSLDIHLWLSRSLSMPFIDQNLFQGFETTYEPL
jgi:hypothetical protein